MDILEGKHLVIFGCGYVGAAVARWALTSGIRVTALTRNSESARLLREGGIHTVVADLASTAWHEQLGERPDFALNCVSSGGGGAESYRHSYLQGTESIVAWAKAHGGVGTFLYTSSTSVYPQGNGVVVRETMPAGASTDRSEILIGTEARVRESAGAWQRWFILRLAGIYGPGRHHLLDQVRSGEVAGTGEPHLNLIHRDDIVTAISACLSAPTAVANEIFNVADDGRATRAEIVAWLAAELGLAPPRFAGPSSTGRRPATPDRVIANDKIKSVVGWRPRYPTFREGYGNLLSR